MPAFTEEINDGPMIVPLLEMRQIQGDQLGTSQTAPQEQCKDCMVPLAFCIPGIRCIEKSAPLSTCQPVSEPHAELFCSLHSADAGRKIGTQQTVVGGLISESAHRC